jgi:DMSO/TMAO reductase YedYZ molybdopterin-dependent catalytic subunit
MATNDVQTEKPAVEIPEKEFVARSRRSFLVLGLGAASGYLGWRWLRTRMDEDGIPSSFRRVFELNRAITSGTLFSNQHLAPQFPLSAVKPIRMNGDYGLDDDVDVEKWRLQLTPYSKSPAQQSISIAQIRQLPKTEHVTQFKCVEGWSTVVHWGGVRLLDFTRHFAPSSEKARYVGLMTPDEEYYVGIDMPSALHPQTLLCYEMNGAPLEDEHGAPLRLVIPVKYGIKNLKRIGSITYTDERPDDYWAERGYDYYAAL